MPQVGFRQAPIELAKAHRGLVDMLVSGPAKRVENADGRAKCNSLAGGGHQLFDRFLVITGFAKYLAIEHGQLVSPDDQGIACRSRHGLGLLSRQPARQLPGTQPVRIALVDIRRDGLIVAKEAIEQTPTIRRGRCEDDRRGRRILHKIKRLGPKNVSLPTLLGRTDIFLRLHFDSSSGGTYHARAMGNPLRDRRTPLELAASGQVIEFSEKIDGFEQLAVIVEGDLESLDPDKLPSGWRDSLVSGRLSFSFADAQNKLPMLVGRVTATLDAVCQRCLEPFEMPLAADLRLLLGEDESAELGDDDFEIWELDEGTFRPQDLVEEALIMAMPYVAMHVDDDACRGPGEKVSEPGDKTRPFAALKAQMEREN